MMYRRRGLGEVGGDMNAEMNQMFNQQLSIHKPILIDLYRKKTKMIAERESNRFKYLSGVKARILSVIGAINSKIYTGASSVGMSGDDSYMDSANIESLVSGFLGIMTMHIPMVNLNGGNIQGWAVGPENVGGPLNVSYLSPIKHIISDLFMPPSDGTDASWVKPAYLVYGETFYAKPTNDILNQYWLSGLDIWNPDLQITVPFTVPPSVDWLNSFAAFYLGRADFVAVSEQALAILNDNYPAGNLFAVLDDAKELFAKIIDETRNIVNVQNLIDAAEADLAAFVAEYTDYIGSDQNVGSILAQLKAEADLDAYVPVNEVPVGSTVVTSAPGGAAQMVEPEVNVPVAKKSSMPWLAAAAVGVYLLTKGK